MTKADIPKDLLLEIQIGAIDDFLELKYGKPLTEPAVFGARARTSLPTADVPEALLAEIDKNSDDWLHLRYLEQMDFLRGLDEDEINW